MDWRCCDGTSADAVRSKTRCAAHLQSKVRSLRSKGISRNTTVGKDRCIIAASRRVNVARGSVAAQSICGTFSSGILAHVITRHVTSNIDNFKSPHNSNNLDNSNKPNNSNKLDNSDKPDNSNKFDNCRKSSNSYLENGTLRRGTIPAATT